MRDIRPDLQERLSSVEKELAGFQEKLRSLESQRDTLRSLLAAENERWESVTSHKEASGNGQATQQDLIGMTALSSILREHLADHKRHHLNELSEAAVKRGYPFGEKKPGRVVHFALLGMKSGNAVEQLGEGYWRLSES